MFGFFKKIDKIIKLLEENNKNLSLLCKCVDDTNWRGKFIRTGIIKENS